MTALLDVQDLSAQFGGIKALNALSMQVGPGEIVGLIGPNGAGKTTAIDALTGFIENVGGRVTFGGRDVTAEAAHRRVTHGMARTWQSGELFEDLTVRENLQVAMDWHVGDEKTSVESIARSLGLDNLDRFPSELPHGQRKLVAVARAMASLPEMLLLDEPGAGLDEVDSKMLGERLSSIAEEGIGIVLVDHNMGLVLSTCDRVYVLQFGQVIAAGTPDEVRTRPEVLEAYLGVQT